MGQEIIQAMSYAGMMLTFLYGVLGLWLLTMIVEALRNRDVIFSLTLVAALVMFIGFIVVI